MATVIGVSKTDHYIVEMSGTEIAHMTGSEYYNSNALNLKVGSIIPINDMWALLTTVRAFKPDLNAAADRLEKQAQVIRTLSRSLLNE